MQTEVSFASLGLAEPLLRAIADTGYTEPTPIQVQAIPMVIEGTDLLAAAQTGTGKTAGFALPLLHRLAATPPDQPANGRPRCLILAPTRELAAQVEQAVQVYGRHLPLSSMVMFGGVPISPQIERLAQPVDVLVATPGRLLDHVGQNTIDLSGVEILVLDEADRMLDMGFIHDVKKVLALLPKAKQSLLFSATFSDEIRQLAGNLLKNPKSIQVTPPNTTVERIAQVIYPVGRERKKEVLAHLIGDGDWSQVLVFTRTKFGANHVAEYLTRHGIKAMALHGNKSQTARTQALGEFKSGELRALVATDIAARGIDIDELPHVVNFEIPNVPEDYVHRIGRTGRAGASGEAVSLVCMDEEGFMHAIEKFTRQQIPVRILDGFGPAEGEQAEPIAMGRQTLWGGLGPAPGRDVMAAAARAARQEMMQRIRDNKARQGQGGGRGNGAGGRGRPAANGQAPRQDMADGEQADEALLADGEGNQGGAPNGAPGEGRNKRRRRRGGRRGGNGGAPAQQGQGQSHHQGQTHQQPARHDGGYDDEDDREPDHLPRHIDPLQTNIHGRRRENRGPSHGAAGQPDPMRTSIDVMGKGGGNRNKRNRGGGGGGGGGNRRSGGFPR